MLCMTKWTHLYTIGANTPCGPDANTSFCLAYHFFCWPHSSCCCGIGVCCESGCRSRFCVTPSVSNRKPRVLRQAQPDLRRRRAFRRGWHSFAEAVGRRPRKPPLDGRSSPSTDTELVAQAIFLPTTQIVICLLILLRPHVGIEGVAVIAVEFDPAEVVVAELVDFLPFTGGIVAFVAK